MLVNRSSSHCHGNPRIFDKGRTPPLDFVFLGLLTSINPKTWAWAPTSAIVQVFPPAVWPRAVRESPQRTGPEAGKL